MALTRKTRGRTPSSVGRRGRKPPRPAEEAREIIDRIDALIRELEQVRQELQKVPKAGPSRDLTDELFGAAGHGTREEYDPLLDYQRFSQWQLR